MLAINHMIYTYILLCFLWIAYCFVHSFLADGSIKTAIQHKTGTSSRFYRLAYNLFAMAGLIAIISFQLNVKCSPIFLQSALTIFFAAILILAGLFIMLICIIKYFKQLSGLKNIKPVLVTTGFHRFVRHPLYLGTFIFLGGAFFAFPLLTNLLSFVIIVLYTLWGIGLEEKKLVKVFGEDYIRYQNAVPKIIPRIHR